MFGLGDVETAILAFAVCVLGAVVGGTEILSRYPDDPRRALSTLPGVSYVLFNALISGLALYAGAAYLGEGRDYTSLPATEWEQVVLAAAFGLGGLAFFRTRIFTLRVGENDVGVGPSFILETILQVIDRAVARRRAVPRSDLVRELMAGVSFDNARVTLPSYCFALMQNVSATEQSQLGLYISSISEMDVPDLVKIDMLGLALMDLVGEEALRTAIKNTKSSLAASTDVLDRIEKTFVDLPFDLGLNELPYLCERMKPVPPEALQELEVEMLAVKRRSLSDRTKSLLLGFALVDLFGWEVVQRAIEAMHPGGIAPSPEAAAETPEAPE